MQHSHAQNPSPEFRPHFHAIALLGEAVIVNRVTGSPASRTRLLALIDMAYAVSAVSAAERLEVIGRAK
jgi:hypothetical protein